MLIHNDPCVHVLLPLQHMSTNTGGPAFPYSALQPGGPTMYADSEGMTLRDYFAAKAMVGILTATAKRDDKNYDEDALAFLSYTVADAMLKARKQA
jgi:hypothetical protein